MGKIKKAGDLFDDFYKTHFDPVTLEEARKTASVLSSWEALAAAAKIPAASDHSRVRELEHGVLVIEAEHPGWIQLLQTKQSQLLKLLQTGFPELEIRGISFCLGKTPMQNTPEPIAHHSTEPPETEFHETEHHDAEHHNAEHYNALYEPLKKFKKIIEKRNKKFSGLE